MADRKIGDLSFGTVLAFAAPGFIGFVAASYHIPSAETMIKAAQSSDQSVGVFLFVALASLTCGVIISGIRDFLFDPVICRSWLFWDVLTAPTTSFAVFQNREVLEAYEATIENYFKYYLFYANSAIALIILTASRLNSSTAPPWPERWWVVVIVLVIILGISARRSLSRFYKRAGEVLSRQQEVK